MWSDIPEIIEEIKRHIGMEGTVTLLNIMKRNVLYNGEDDL